MFFSGTFDYAIDERGRVPLPPRYRDAFRDGIVLSQGSPDPCIRVMPPAAYLAQARAYTSESALHRRGRELRRALFGRTWEVEFDKQNRVLIPMPLRLHAGLSKDVLVVGTGEYLEIWAPETYVTMMEQLDAGLETTLESTEPERT